MRVPAVYLLCPSCSRSELRLFANCRSFVTRSGPALPSCHLSNLSNVTSPTEYQRAAETDVIASTQVLFWNKHIVTRYSLGPRCFPAYPAFKRIRCWLICYSTNHLGQNCTCDSKPQTLRRWDAGPTPPCSINLCVCQAASTPTHSASAFFRLQVWHALTAPPIAQLTTASQLAASSRKELASLPTSPSFASIIKREQYRNIRETYFASVSAAIPVVLYCLRYVIRLYACIA
jgi:hypothetical protein